MILGSGPRGSATGILQATDNSEMGSSLAEASSLLDAHAAKVQHHRTINGRQNPLGR